MTDIDLVDEWTDEYRKKLQNPNFTKVKHCPENPLDGSFRTMKSTSRGHFIVSTETAVGIQFNLNPEINYIVFTDPDGTESYYIRLDEDKDD